MKRIACILLAMVMVFSMLPTGFAEGETSGFSDNPAEIHPAESDFDEAAADQSGEYDHEDDILAASIEVPREYGFCGDNTKYELTATGILILTGSGAVTSAPWTNSNVYSVRIGRYITSLPDRAFENATHLKTIEIPDAVTKLGKECFANCTGLENVTLPDSFQHIPQGAFVSCTSLKTLSFPSSLISIGQDAFNSCLSFSLVYDELPDTLVSIGGGAFYNCRALTIRSIPASVRTIGNYAFYRCNITYITIPATVTSWGSGVFSTCGELERAEFASGVTIIPNGVFDFCQKLSKVTIPNSVTVIGEDAFKDCTALKTLNLPSNVRSIGEGAFADTNNLTISFLGDAPTFNAKAFQNANATVIVPSSNSTWTSSVKQNYGGSVTWQVSRVNEDQAYWNAHKIGAGGLSLKGNGIHYYYHPSSEHINNPPEGEINGVWSAEYIGRNKSGEYFYSLYNWSDHEYYVYADEVTPLYQRNGDRSCTCVLDDNNNRFSCILNNNNIRLEGSSTPYFTSSYKLNGFAEYGDGRDIVTIDTITVEVKRSDAASDADPDLKASVSPNVRSYYEYPNSALADKVDFSKLTVGQHYTMTITTKITDHYHPVSRTSVADHTFYDEWRVDFILQQGEEKPEEVHVSCSNPRAPSGTLTYGSKFTLKGKITATGANLSQVGARVYAASDTTLKTPLTGTTVNTTAASYSIEGSKLDTSCKFATLEPGSYIYVITAKAGGKSFELYRSSFKVSTPYYTVSYNGNGYWTGIPNDQKKQYNVDLKLSSAVPARDNYDFLGWATSKTATTATYQPGDTYKANKNVTLYAVWKKLTTTIELHPNDYRLSNEVITIPAGSSYQLGGENYERSGYDFIGWRQDGSTWDGSGLEYHVGDVYNSIEDITLWGVWKLKEYTLTFDANGGTGAPDPITYLDGQSCTFPTQIPEKEGYVFDGWSYYWNTYYPGQITNQLPAKDATLMAVWRNQGTAKLTTHIWKGSEEYGYDVSPENGIHGFYSSDIDSLKQNESIASDAFIETVKSDTTNMLGKTIRENGMERMLEIDDHDFWYYVKINNRYTPVRITGWSTEEHGQGELVTPDTVLNGDMDIYPIYEIGYYVTLENNGGVGGPGKYLESPGAFRFPDSCPTMEGCTFLGWSEDSQATEATYLPGDTYTAASWYEKYGHHDIVFHAVWSGAYSVSYSADFGRSGSTVTYPEMFKNTKTYYLGGEYTVPEDVPTMTFTASDGNTGTYAFLGWSTESNADEPDYLPGMTYRINANITLHPVWRPEFSCLCMQVYIDGSGNQYPVRPSFATGKHSLRVITGWYSQLSPEKGKTVEEYGWTLYDETNCQGVLTLELETQRIDGWYTEQEGAGERITMRTEINGFLNAYAKLSDAEFRTKYSANGGIGTPEPEYTNTGEAFTVTSVVPTRFDYAFLGWATSPEAAAAEYAAGDSFTPVEDTTLYAVWEYHPHTHETELVNMKEQSCTEEGYTGDLVCTVCGETLQHGSIIPTHTRETIIDVISERTCTEDGTYEEVVICTVCGEELSRETRTEPAPGYHQPSAPIKENKVDATETSSGSFDEVVYCEACQEELSRNTIIIPREIVFEQREVSLPFELVSSYNPLLLDRDTGDAVQSRDMFNWTSNDESVALVDESGLVTPVNTGTAVITAKGENGKSTFCIIHVCPLPQKLLKIPDGTAAIEEEAFTNTAVEYALIPESVETIGAGAFAFNESLLIAEFMSGNTVIDDTAFHECNNLIILAPPAGTVEAWANDHNIAFKAK